VAAQPQPDGELLVLAEADYLYGTGRLILRVGHIDRSHPISYDGEAWFPVRGVQFSAYGVEMGDRETLVRGRRLFK
jgi:hypothetical protein